MKRRDLWQFQWDVEYYIESGSMALILYCEDYDENIKYQGKTIGKDYRKVGFQGTIYDPGYQSKHQYSEHAIRDSICFFFADYFQQLGK